MNDEKMKLEQVSYVCARNYFICNSLTFLLASLPLATNTVILGPHLPSYYIYSTHICCPRGFASLSVLNFGDFFKISPEISGFPSKRNDMQHFVTVPNFCVKFPKFRSISDISAAISLFKNRPKLG